jgi:hypothetical protein
VPSHEGRQGCFFMTAKEALQKLAIGQFRSVSPEHCFAKVVEDLGHGAVALSWCPVTGL